MISSEPSKTALRVALRRAAHQVQDQPPLVFDDPLAVKILGPEYAAEIARTPDAEKRPYSAGIRAFMVGRARLAEDALAERYRNADVRQYLVLGAGLDTFAYRQQLEGLRVFEVDHPATQSWKREMLAQAGIPCPESMQFVPVDFERDSLEQRLLQAGLDLSRPVMTAWLGVVPYLTEGAFRATAKLLGRFAPGSAVLFDYALPREALGPVEQRMLDSMAQRVRQAGEPFQLFFRPEELRAEMASAGLEVVEDLGGADISARLFRDRTDGLTLKGAAGRVCYAVCSASFSRRLTR